MAQKQQSKSAYNRYLPLVLILVAFLCYANTLSHDYALDDNSVIKENIIVKQGADGIGQLMNTSYRAGYWSDKGTLYRPLSLVMFAIEWEVWPDNPTPSHWINVLLFALIVWVVFILMKQLFNSSKEDLIFPFLVALLVAVHPIHTEVVANIKSRDEILSMLFGLLQVYCFLKYWDEQKKSALVLSVVSFVLAMLSKESSILFSAFLILAVLMFRKVELKKHWKLALPFLVVFALYLVQRNAVLGGLEAVNSVGVIDNYLVGAEGNGGLFANAFHVLGVYLFKLFVPVNLLSDASIQHFEFISIGSWKFLLAFVSHLGILGFSIWGFKKYPVFSFAGIFYLIGVLFVSNLFFITGTGYGERLLFVPSLVVAMAVAYGLSNLFKRKNKSVFYLLTALIVLPYVGMTINRNSDWKDNQTLFEADVEKAPNSAKLKLMLAMEYIQQAKELQDPQAQLELNTKAEQLVRASLEIYSDNADTYERLGVICYRTGRKEEAIQHYRKAIEINPSLTSAYNNLGVVYFEQQNWDKTIEVLTKAVELNPNFADAYLNLGSAFGARAQKLAQQDLNKAEHYFESALKCFVRCLQIEPNNASARQFKALTVQNLQQIREVKSQIQH